MFFNRRMTVAVVALTILCVLSCFFFREPTVKGQGGKDEKPVPNQDALYLVAKSTPKELSNDEVRSQLKVLFRWPGSKAYQFCFIWLPKYIDIGDQAKGDFDSMKDKNWKINPYSDVRIAAATDQFSGAAITFVVPKDFERIPDRKGLCVVLDGLGAKVPVRAAGTFASYFAHGLVTRLVLGEYAKAWKKEGDKFELQKLDFAKDVMSEDIPLPSAYEQLASYATDGVDSNKGFDFDNRLSKLLIENNLQAAGILWGWRAAGQLDSLKGEDRAATLAVWKLVKSRFSAEQLGEMTAYTLNYLIGYVKVATLRADLASQPNAPKRLPENHTRDLPTLLDNLSKDTNVKEAKNLLALMHEAFLLEFHALTHDERLDKDKKKELLAWSFAFIRGFQSGSVKAFDDVFNDVFREGYKIGYQDGFRDGYAKGYADGYRDGYAVGYKQAWSEANVVINQLKAELEQERSGGFFGFLGKVIGVVGSVVGIIAGL